MDNRLQLIIEAQNKASAQLQQIARDVESLGKSTADHAGKMAKGFDLAKVGLGGLAAGAIAYKAIDIGKEFAAAGLAAERMAIGLQSALGSLDAAAGAEKYLRAESERLGLAFTDQIKSYVSLSAAAKGTAMEGENTRKIFSAVAEASVALGLRAEETSGALVAIQQMMSKGTVSAEELRGQLGERLPGAFNVAARAMGVTTQELGKMLEQGEIVAADFLPKLARALSEEYGPAAARAADSTQAAVTRMNNAWEEAKRAIGERLLPYMAWAAEQINNTIQTIIPSTLEAKAKSLESEISSLKKQISQPFYFGGDKNRLKQLEGELVAVQREISGVGNKTGEWAQGAIALKESLKDQTSMVKNVTDASQVFSQSDFMQGRNRRGLDQLQLYVDQTKQHEAALKGATKEARNYFDTVKDVASMNTGHLSSAIDAYKSLADEWAKLTLSATAYQKLALDEWFAREAEKVGADNEMLLKLYATKKLILQVNEAYQAAPLKDDPWIKHYKKKEELAADAEKTIAETAKKEQDDLAKSVDRLWENTWQNLQKTYSDIIYDMLSGDLSTWDDYFQSIKSLFMRLIAEMVALWSVSFIKEIFAGGGVSGGLAAIFGGGHSATSGAAGAAGAVGLAGALGGLKNAAAAVTDWLGLTGYAADSASVAISHAATTATGAAAKMAAYEAALASAGAETSAVASGMYEFGASAQTASAAVSGLGLSLTGIGVVIGAALGGSLGLDEALFGSDHKSTLQTLRDWEAGVRDLSAAQVTYYKAAYLYPLTGIDPDMMVDSVELQKQYAAALNMTVDQMFGLREQLAMVDVALRQEAGLLDWMNTTLVDSTSEALRFELDQMLSDFEITPSDEWYRLKIGVDMAGVDPMNIDAKASGGPVSAHTPYIVGEEGAELFWPTTSGHILNHSDTQKLLSLGIKGYASGTASLRWYEDPATHSSGTTEQDMWEDIYATVSDFLDLMTDLQKEIEDINGSFEDWIETAEKVGATQEELDDIYEMWSESLQKSADDWAESLKDGVRDMLGVSGGIRDTLADIRDQFEEWTADLNSLIEAGLDAGITEAELQALEAVSIAKAISGAIKDLTSGLRDLQFSIASWVGTVTGTASDLENAYYALVYARAQFGPGGIFDFSGLSDSELSDYAQDLEAYFQSVFTTLSSAYEAFMGQQDTITKKIEDITVAGMSLADRSAYYAGVIYDKLNELSALPTDRVEDAVELTSALYDQVLAYYDAEKAAIEDRYQTEVDAINETYDALSDMVTALERVNSKIRSLTYSSYNLALPTPKAESAAQDYAGLFAAAQTMDPDAVDDYLGFIDTYLQAGQSAYKSSKTYTDMYDQVMADLASLGLSATSVQGKTLEDLTEEQNGLLADLEEAMKQELATLDQTIISSLEILDGMISDEMEDVASLLALLWTGIQDITGQLSTSLMEAALGEINDTLWTFMGGVGTYLQIMDGNNTANTDRIIYALMGFSGGGGGLGVAPMTYADFYGYMNAFTQQLGEALYVLDINEAARDSQATTLLTDIKSILTTMSGKLSYYDASLRTEFSSAALMFGMYYAQRDLNRALGVPGYAEGGISSGPMSGYPVMLHGTEAVIPLSGGVIPVQITGPASGAGDPEVVSLLRELVAVAGQRQRCEIVLDSGERLSGYIRREADTVRVAANERRGTSRRRLY